MAPPDLKACAEFTEKSKRDDYEKGRKHAFTKIGDNALDMFADSGYSSKDLRHMTRAVNNIHKCDSDCQQQKKEDLLYKLWREAKTEEDIAEVNVIVKARDYFLGGNGRTNESYHKDYVTPRIEEEFAENSNLINMKSSDLSGAFHTMSASYDTEQLTLAEMNNLFQMKRQEIDKLNKQIIDYEKYRNVDVRKNFYEYNEQEFYNYIKFYIQIIYYALIIVYLFFVDDFMTNQRYSDWRFYLVLTLYVVLPFSIKYIVGFVGAIYNYIAEYFGWKEPIYSYEDLVKNERHPR